MKSTGVAIVGGLSVLAALLTGCGSDSKSAADKKPVNPAQSIPPAQVVRSKMLAPGYHTWRGQLLGSTDSITLHILQVYAANASEKQSTMAASYTESGSGRTHYLLVWEASSDSLVLEESSNEMTGGSSSPESLWKLAWRGTNLIGTYAGQPLTLRAGRAPGSVMMMPTFFADSVIADVRFPDSVHGYVSLLAVQPTSGPPALKAAFLSMVRGDTTNLLPPVPSLSVQWAAMRQQFRAEYLADVQLVHQQEGDSAIASSVLNYALSYSARVIWNETGLLSLGRYTYEYRGGAHGFYYTKVASFDIRTGRRITYDDIFLPRANQQLSAALDRAARLRYGLAPTAPLGGEDGEGPLFVEHIPVTRNVCLTGGGVLFVYPPYDLASFADGEIELFVPFSELRGLMKPGLPGIKAEALTQR
jgi:Protein of unknown function (DUF3298)